jgi:protein O-mannosyl-transferase
MLSRKYRLLLLAAATLTVFYPSIFAELNSIDDMEMVTNLLNMDGWSLKELFFPGAGGGLYYRPVLFATFIFDRFAWDAGTSFMHLENILLHLCNAFLLYLLAEQLVPQESRAKSWLPFVAAICFALHPIVTEPVNWVSARTDLLAGAFVLASALFLLRYKNIHRKRYLLISMGCFLLGMLSKEVALLFLPGGLFILVANGVDDKGESTPEYLRAHWKKLVLFLGIGCGSLAMFFLLRSVAYSSNSSRIGMTLKFMGNDPAHTMFVFLRAFGFYIKKVFWPFPLNFAIVEVDPLYELLAMGVLLPILYVAWKRSLASAILIAGLFMIVPAFPIAFNQVAWTPYAERYIYIATAFVLVGTVFLLSGQSGALANSQLARPCGLLEGEAHTTGRVDGRLWSYLAVCCLVAAIGISTFLRNLTWQTNISLFADSVKKSPTYSKVWNQLGIAYYNKHDLRNAEINFAKASSLFEMNFDEKSDLNLALVLKQEGKLREAEEVYTNVVKSGGFRSEKVVDHYVGFLQDKATREKDPGLVAEIRKEMLQTYEKNYMATKSPQTLYKIGNVRGELGDRRGARSAYLIAYEMLPAKDKYREMIRKRLPDLDLK